MMYRKKKICQPVILGRTQHKAMWGLLCIDVYVCCLREDQCQEVLQIHVDSNGIILNSHYNNIQSYKISDIGLKICL